MSTPNAKKRGGVDMNDLVLDRAKYMRLLAHVVTGKWLDHRDLRRERAVQKRLITEAQYTRIVNALYDRDYLELILQADPMKGALEGLRELVADGWTVPIVSAIDQDAFELLMQWCRTHGLEQEHTPFFAVGREGSKNQFGRFLTYADNDVRQLDVMSPATQFLILFDRYGMRRAKRQRIGALKVGLFNRRIRIQCSETGECERVTRTIIVVHNWEQLVGAMKFIGENPERAEKQLVLT